ncbi:MAG: hypothetical protein JW843_09285 [Candidatus Aminicenantes bacterium]|nr:hypothetical protein [Candidatus Aminicenantes bacterium]
MRWWKFDRRLRDCPDCRTEDDLDRRLAEETMKLRAPLSAPGLWDRIESALRVEAAAEDRRSECVPRRDGRRPFRLAPVLVPVSALIVLFISLLLFRPAPSVRDSGLLAQRALTEVEAREADYLAAIEDLERSARDKIDSMDLTLMSLYRDRLAVIDSQIAKCRDALAENPANAHIRRYLLAALQDKRQTLAEVLGS